MIMGRFADLDILSGADQGLRAVPQPRKWNDRKDGSAEINGV